jgi:hypothetical protein
MENQMFIQTEATPNPATQKFLPGKVVMENGTAEFRSTEEAAGSPPACSKYQATPASISAMISFPSPRTMPTGNILSRLY